MAAAHTVTQNLQPVAAFRAQSDASSPHFAAATSSPDTIADGSDVGMQALPNNLKSLIPQPSLVPFKNLLPPGTTFNCAT
jgi:hypothetical protein